MAIKVRLPNARYIKVNTDDPEYAKARAIEYYKSGEAGFIDQKTQTMATQFDKEQFDYESGVQAPWAKNEAWSDGNSWRKRKSFRRGCRK